MQVVVVPPISITQGLECNPNWRMRDRYANEYVDLTDWSGVFSLFDEHRAIVHTQALVLSELGEIALSIPATTTATFTDGRALCGLLAGAYQIDLTAPEAALSEKWQGAALIFRNLTA